MSNFVARARRHHQMASLTFPSSTFIPHISAGEVMMEPTIIDGCLDCLPFTLKWLSITCILILLVSSGRTAIAGFLRKLKTACATSEACPLVNLFCCPKRRLRFHKCLKRSKREADNDGDCWIMAALQKMQELPPPLPFAPRRRRKKEQKAEALSTIKRKSLPRSTLLDLIRMQQWSSVVSRREEVLVRKQAKHHDAEGLYPLHWACSGGPPSDLIQALVDSYPSAVTKTDKEGSTPLHFACHYSASPQVVDALLSVYPEASSIQDKYGRTPLFHAVDKGASLHTLESLLRKAPSAATQPCIPATIATRLTDNQNGKITREVAIRSPLYLIWASVMDDPSARRNCQSKKWIKAELLLQTAYYQKHTGVSLTKQKLIHMLLAMDSYLPDKVLPSRIARLTTDIDQEDAQTLLHSAASTDFYSVQRAVDINNILHTLVGPRLCYRNTSLAVASAGGQPWQVIESIFQYEPNAIGWSDPETNLPPVFAAAAAVGRRSESPNPAPAALLQWLTNRDPYALLSRKQREVLRTQRSLVEDTQLDSASMNPEPQLDDVYRLLRLDPTVISRASVNK